MTLRNAIICTLFILLIPALAGAEDALPALEEMRAEINQLKASTGGAIAIIGIAIGVYGYANWKDAQDQDDAPGARHVAMMMGGIAAVFGGIGIAVR